MRTSIPMSLLLACSLIAGCAQASSKPEALLVLPLEGRQSSGLDAYTENIRRAVRRQLVLPTNISGNPEAVLSLIQLPSGEVLDIRILASSGSAGLDVALVRAVQKASPLPLPDDPALFRRELIIKYRPLAE